MTRGEINRLDGIETELAQLAEIARHSASGNQLVPARINDGIADYLFRIAADITTIIQTTRPA